MAASGKLTYFTELLETKWVNHLIGGLSSGFAIRREIYCDQRQAIKKLPSAWSLRDYPCRVCGKTRPSDRVWKKMKNYAEIFGNIMWKKVTIMQERRQIMQKFLK